MPIQHSLWALSGRARPLAPTRLESEKLLEDLIVENPSILNPSWMIIGRQVITDYRGVIDVLALQPDGSPVLIELKREKTPRDVTSQLIDYAAWVERVSAERLQQIYEDFLPGGSLQSDYEARFNTEWDEENLRGDIQLVLVASELDSASERIVSFLSDRGISINVLFFQAFEDEGRLYLSRSWLVDPVVVQTASNPRQDKGTWNGEFYANYGVDEKYRWEDGRRLGFITASGGPWYTQTLRMLDVGDRVWVNVPKIGYVGVGIVEGEAQPVTDFMVTESGESKPIVEASTEGDYLADGTGENCAWFVPMNWSHTVPEKEAVREVGFFGNQNSVAKPKSEKWHHTVKTLKSRWKLDH